MLLTTEPFPQLHNLKGTLEQPKLGKQEAGPLLFFHNIGQECQEMEASYLTKSNCVQSRENVFMVSEDLSDLPSTTMRYHFFLAISLLISSFLQVKFISGV